MRTAHLQHSSSAWGLGRLRSVAFVYLAQHCASSLGIAIKPASHDQSTRVDRGMIDCLTNFAHHFLLIWCVAFAVSDACKLGRGRAVLECELELLLDMLRGDEFWRRVGSCLLEVAT